MTLGSEALCSVVSCLLVRRTVSNCSSREPAARGAFTKNVTRGTLLLQRWRVHDYRYARPTRWICGWPSAINPRRRHRRVEEMTDGPTRRTSRSMACDTRCTSDKTGDSAAGPWLPRSPGQWAPRQTLVVPRGLRVAARIEKSTVESPESLRSDPNTVSVFLLTRSVCRSERSGYTKTLDGECAKVLANCVTQRALRKLTSFVFSHDASHCLEFDASNILTGRK